MSGWTCGALTPYRGDRWRRCRQPIPHGRRVCDECAAAIVQDGQAEPVTSEDVAAAIVEAEAAPARERRVRREAAAAAGRARRRLVEAESVVYYVRTGVGTIKIGTTEHLAERMRAFRVANPDNLLAVEPGGYDLEARRHEQFRAWRYHRRREDFGDAPQLLAHIAVVRSEHGDPRAYLDDRSRP